MPQRPDPMVDTSHDLTQPLDRLSDEDLIECVLAGDTASFAPIMRRYNQRMFRVVRSILGDDGEAEDVLQEAYVRAFEHLGRFEGRAKFSTWLTRIAVHEAYARLRRRRLVRFVDLSDAESQWMTPETDENSAANAVDRHELGGLLRRAIDQLPEDLRSVLTLRLVEELSTDETADCLGLSPANVKVRLHRARLRLRSGIEKHIGGELQQLYQFDGERCNRIVRTVMERLALHNAHSRSSGESFCPNRLSSERSLSCCVENAPCSGTDCGGR